MKHGNEVKSFRIYQTTLVHNPMHNHTLCCCYDCVTSLHCPTAMQSARMDVEMGFAIRTKGLRDVHECCEALNCFMIST